MRRKIVSDPICPLCGREMETSGHVLWNCDVARAVWSESPRAMQKCAVEANDFSLIFNHLCERLSVEDLELAAVIAHRIWLRRNQWVFENSFLPPKCLLKGAADSLLQFRMANSLSPNSASQISPSVTGWKPPSADTVKVNWDAAIDKRKNLMGVGDIARNHFGEVLAAQCAVQRYIVDPAVAEAIGAKMGAALGRLLGLQSIFLEGDASAVVAALKRDDEEYNRFESIETLKVFPEWDVGAVRRNCNNVAHQLAKLVVSQELNQIWLYSFPSCIFDAVYAERGLSSS